MAAETWTTTELLEAIREIGRIPDDTPDATDAKLLREANRIMVEDFVPMVRKARSEFYVAFLDQDIETGVASYRIPHRATTSSVREVVILDSSGGHQPLQPAAHGDQHGYQPSRGAPTHYTIADDQVVLLPTPYSSNLGTLRIYYERRPSTLVLPAAAAALDTLITEPEEGADYWTIRYSSSGSPPTFAVNDLVDLVRKRPPFSLAFASEPVLASTGPVAGLYLIGIDPDVQEPSAGDFLCDEGETPIPQIPPELHPTLARAVVGAWLLPIDPNGAAVHLGKVQASLAEFGGLLAPRQQGRQQKIRSTSSIMRRGARRRGHGTFWDW